MDNNERRLNKPPSVCMMSFICVISFTVSNKTTPEASHKCRMRQDNGVPKKILIMVNIFRTFNKIDLNLNDKIVWVKQRRRDCNFIPMVELKVDSKEAAYKLRTLFVAKKRSGVEFGPLHLAKASIWAPGSRQTFSRPSHLSSQTLIEMNSVMYSKMDPFLILLDITFVWIELP